MIKMNTEMNRLLKEINKIKDDELKISSKTLNDILMPDFLEVDDVILIKLSGDKIPQGISNKSITLSYGNKTNYEASLNEFYVNKYIDYQNDNELLALSFGVQLIECWSYKLKFEYPDYKFNLILRYSDGEVYIKFHKIREDEALWLDNNIENYKYEGIMIKQI